MASLAGLGRLARSYARACAAVARSRPGRCCCATAPADRRGAAAQPSGDRPDRLTGRPPYRYLLPLGEAQIPPLQVTTREDGHHRVTEPLQTSPAVRPATAAASVRNSPACNAARTAESAPAPSDPENRTAISTTPSQQCVATTARTQGSSCGRASTPSHQRKVCAAPPGNSGLGRTGVHSSMRVGARLAARSWGCRGRSEVRWSTPWRVRRGLRLTHLDRSSPVRRSVDHPRQVRIDVAR
jgi:hypothetical protein